MILADQVHEDAAVGLLPSLGSWLRGAAVLTTRKEWYDKPGAIPDEVISAIRKRFGIGWWSIDLRLYGYEDINENQLFTRYEQLLFSRVTAVAEKAGKHVDLLVVPGTNVYDAIAQTAAHLDSADIWAGRSSAIEREPPYAS